MLLDSLTVDRDELARRTGWEIKGVTACKGDACVPLPAGTVRGNAVDVAAFATRLRMPLVADTAHGLWSLGPESGGRALTTAAAPDLELPDLDGKMFSLRSLRGQKVVLVAWASW